MSTTINAQDLEKDMQEVFKPLLVKVKKVGEKFQFHVSGPVKHHQLQQVMAVGETEVLRSGAGVTITITPTVSEDTNQKQEEEIPESIMDRIKTFDDVLEVLEIDKADFEKSLHGLSPDEAAYRKVKLIAEALNEGWQPEWDNGKWDKWYPWFYMPNSSGSGFAFFGADDPALGLGRRLPPLL